MIPWMEDDPDLTAPQLWVNRTLQHMEDAYKYGCSGLLGIHWRTRAVGPQIQAMGQKSWNFNLTSQEFWVDWVATQFGQGAGTPVNTVVADVFDSIDSFLMPLVVSWASGPGQIIPKCMDMTAFNFVDTLQSVSANISGATNSDRFNYWLSSFNYMKSIATTACAAKEYNDIAATIAKTTDPTTQKQLAQSEGLPARVRVIANATTMMSNLQQTISTPGELGTYMNIESHSLTHIIRDPEAQLQKWLGVTALPANAVPPQTYDASLEPRLIVPTARTVLEAHTPLDIRALLLSADDCTADTTKVTLYWRNLGGTDYTDVPLIRAVEGRCVFETVNIAPFTDDFDWYVEAVVGSKSVYFPAGAPAAPVSVVILGPN